MPSNKNLGNAGEFYVLAQLAQRGYIAGKTDDGQTLIDVIATDPESLNTVNIQVKTRTIDGKISSWLMSEKNEKVFEKLWYVVVEVGDDDVLPNFFIFSSKEVSDSIKQRLIDYLAKPKKDGTPRKGGGSIRHFEPSEEFKAERKNNWEIMFK
tara:strand:- start:20 stop:478 length:459 start_codon:yes stop_codon:yes gene_type:complete